MERPISRGNYVGYSKQTVKAWLLIPFGWLTIACIQSLPPTILRTVNGTWNFMPWPQRLEMQIRAYAFWMLLTPITMWFIHSIFERRRRFRFALSGIAGVAYVFTMTWLRINVHLPFSTYFDRWSTWKALALALPPGFLAYTLTAVALLGGHMVRTRAELAEARLAALRAQLHPHFLFNSLNGIAALTEQRPAEARDMLSRLGDLLRRVLGTNETDRVTLASELEWLEDYIDLQRMRIGERVDFQFDVEPGAAGVLVPQLLLQPLVENALEHGLVDGSGTITIRATRTDGRVQLSVHDNGVGYQTNGRNGGIGLNNTMQRLKTIYGDAHRFDIRRAAGGGTNVEIELPLQLASQS
jgi:signal transduction histidine kinase